MTAFLVVGGLFVGFAVLLLRSLAVDEVRGRLHRRLRGDLERIIDTLPAELQEGWAEEWRAELEAIITAPLAAISFVRGVKQSTQELAGAPQPVAVTTSSGADVAGRLPLYPARRLFDAIRRLSHRYERRVWILITIATVTLFETWSLLSNHSFAEQLTATALVLAVLLGGTYFFVRRQR